MSKKEYLVTFMNTVSIEAYSEEDAKEIALGQFTLTDVEVTAEKA